MNEKMIRKCSQVLFKGVKKSLYQEIEYLLH